MAEILSAKRMKALNAVLAKAAAFEKKGLLAEAARSYRFFLSQCQDAAVFYNYGIVLKNSGDLEAALRSYRQAISLKPDYAQAYANIGNILMERKSFEEALEYHDLAVRHGPGLAAVHYNRGVVLQELRRHDEALRDYDHALALQPDFYLAYLNKSVILYELKRKPEAELNYRRLLQRDSCNMDAAWNLGILRLSEGDFAAGWELSEARLRPHSQAHRDRFKKPRWSGAEDIAGKTLLIVWEQGFGDTIQFCRYASLARHRGARVLLSVQQPLRRLLSTLDHDITVLGEDELPRDFDYYCFLLSLPSIFGTLMESVPSPTKYLRADTGLAAGWRARIGNIPGARIGLVWAGGERAEITCARRNDANRSIPLDRWKPLFEIAGAAFFSLQKGPPAAQVARLPPGYQFHDWSVDFADFADTAALIGNLDLVITVDTAVAHLAAALGKPVWILLPWVSCWRWLEQRDDSPWYASVRLFRQSERGNWDHVFEAVDRALRGFVHNRKPDALQAGTHLT